MRELYEKYLGNKYDRAATIGAGSFLINAITGIGQLIFGIVLDSPWYIINSVYYLLLCIARGQVLRKYRNIRNIKDEKNRYDYEFAVHKNAGIFICLMAIAYLSTCVWMYITGEARVQNEISLVLAVATIAFSKIGSAIYGMISNRHMHDPIISILKKISFLDAFVSIVVTQCSLLIMTEVSQAVSSSALFGMGVSFLFFVIGIFTIKKKKKYPTAKILKKEKQMMSSNIRILFFIKRLKKSNKILH